MYLLFASWAHVFDVCYLVLVGACLFCFVWYKLYLPTLICMYVISISISMRIHICTTCVSLYQYATSPACNDICYSWHDLWFAIYIWHCGKKALHSWVPTKNERSVRANTCSRTIRARRVGLNTQLYRVSHGAGPMHTSFDHKIRRKTCTPLELGPQLCPRASATKFRAGQALTWGWAHELGPRACGTKFGAGQTPTWSLAHEPGPPAGTTSWAHELVAPIFEAHAPLTHT